MFEVKVGTETFVFESFSEIEEFFTEVVFAQGAEDAKIEIRMADQGLIPSSFEGIFTFSLPLIHPRRIILT